MKGKNTFTATEIEKLKDLIRLRNKTEASKQKAIRDKMRKMGFYGKDDWGITDLQENDIDRLIQSGSLKVTSNPVTFEGTPKEKRTTKETPHETVNTNLTTLLNQFAKNSFNPLKDNPSKIADAAGNYIICLKLDKNLPDIGIKPILKTFQNQAVIYTGIAGASLRKRDYKQHFTGNNAGRSTLRKSLGCMLGFKLIPRDKDPNTGKTKFKPTDEEKLSQWMTQNLIMYFFPNTHHNKIETQLINHFNPPLNLSKNRNSINANFRKKLSLLRNPKKQPD